MKGCGDWPAVANRPVVRLAVLDRVRMSEAAACAEEAASLGHDQVGRAGDRDEGGPCAERVPGVLEEDRAERRIDAESERPRVLRLAGQHHLEVGCQPQPPGPRRVVPGDLSDRWNLYGQPERARGENQLRAR